MTASATAVRAPSNPVARAVTTVNASLALIPDALVRLLVRVAVAHVFWASGRTKVEGWSLKPITVDLFRAEYALPLISPELAAYAAATAEHLLPLLLVIGLASRMAATGLFAMTMIIQIFVYPEAWWAQHSLWAALLLVIMAGGPGKLSLDQLIARRSRGRR